MRASVACVTVKVWSPMEIVPVRVPPASAATAYPTVPSPEPEAPDVIAIHEALLAAVQEHPAVALMGIVPAPPVAPNAAADWLRADIHFV
jgi:hypothetical protein